MEIEGGAIRLLYYITMKVVELLWKINNGHAVHSKQQWEGLGYERCNQIGKLQTT